MAVRSAVGSAVRSPVRGVLGGGATQTDLQRLLALSPSLVIWPAQATMTQATNGTGAAPGSGDPVGRILDLSGNGNNLIAGTWASPSDAARGTFQNNAISFSGVDDYYSLLNAISITTNVTVVRAFKRASAGIKSAGIGKSGVAAVPRDLLWFTDNEYYVGLGTSQTNTGLNTSTGSFVATTKRTVSTQEVRLNGSVIVTGSPPSISTSTLDQIGLLGTAEYNSGEISFLAVFPTELTGADLTLVEQIAAATNGAVLS